MIARPTLLKRFGSDRRGAVLVEFALLAPALLTLIFGVLTMGLHLFSSNALTSVGADAARYTVVEYQKSDELTDEQIASKAVAIAVNPPYGLDIDRLDVTVTRPTTDITGTIKFQLTMTYTPYNPLEFSGIGSPQINTTRTFYVSSSS